MRLITVATEGAAYFAYLKKSCERFGAQLDVLGWDQKWQGFAWKLMLMMDHIQKLDDNEVVCFIDAYDVILLRPLAELESAFEKITAETGARIVVGCDKPPTHMMSWASAWLFKKCQDKRVNSGTYMGRVRDVRDMLTYIFPSSARNAAQDDQMLLIEYCLHEPQRIFIDCDNRMFLTILNTLKAVTGVDVVDEPGLSGGKAVSYNGMRPFILHANGQTDMGDVISALGYDITEEEKGAVRAYHRRVTFNKAFVYMPYLPFTNILFTILMIAISVYLYRKKPR